MTFIGKFAAFSKGFSLSGTVIRSVSPSFNSGLPTKSPPFSFTESGVFLIKVAVLAEKCLSINLLSGWLSVILKVKIFSILIGFEK